MGSLLDNKSDSDDTDLSDSEMDVRAETTYQELRKGKHSVRNYDGTFNCPFCFKKRTQPYQYTDLLQHAFGVGHSSSDKRSVKEKAKHQALVKYLENELAAAASSSKPAPQSQPHAGCSREMGNRVGNSVCHSSNNDVNIGEKDNDTEMSESEMDEYVDKCYQHLKNGNQSVRNSLKTYACPYCPKKRKQDYFYHEILQHAIGVGNSPSDKRSVRQKATHMALAKYLETDVTRPACPPNTEPSPLKPEQSPSKPKPPETVGDPVGNRDHGEKFVWPWTGIVVNIPTTRTADGRFVGASGSKFRDELTSRGFNPIRVHPLWNFRGHSGYAVVEFNKDWPGFHNAISFEKAYELDRHGKREYFAKDVEKIGVYCWVARADDYFADNIIGEHLRKTADLKTISEIMEEESRKTDKLLSNLNHLYETKNRHLKEMETRCNETSASMNKLMEEKDVLLQQYNEEIRKVQANARDHFQRIFNDHEKFKLQLESEKRELELRGSELEKREAKNEIDRKQLSEELEQNAVRNSSLQLAALEQEKADEDVMKLVEEQKKEKEKLHKRIIELEKQRDKKQALELEIEEMRGQLNVMHHLVDDGDVEVLKKVEAIIGNLKEKEGELEDLEALNQTLIIKERNTNDELQEARKELISGLKEISIRAPIRVKRMGELDTKPFLEFMRQKYPEDLAEVKTTEICSLWEEYLKDPGWHPFKTVTIEGTDKEIINEDDERLKNLKNEMGDKVFEAVAAALKEINEYNPSGRYITSELWNYGEGRKASLGEGVSFILQQYKTLKNRRPA